MFNVRGAPFLGWMDVLTIGRLRSSMTRLNFDAVVEGREAATILKRFGYTDLSPFSKESWLAYAGQHLAYQHINYSSAANSRFHHHPSLGFR